MNLSPAQFQDEILNLAKRMELVGGMKVALIGFLIPVDEHGNFHGVAMGSTFHLDPNNAMPLIHTMFQAVAASAAGAPGGPQH